LTCCQISDINQGVNFRPFLSNQQCERPTSLSNVTLVKVDDLCIFYPPPPHYAKDIFDAAIAT